MQLFRTILIACHLIFWWIPRFWYFSLTVKFCFLFNNAKFFFCFYLHIFFDLRAFDRNVFLRITIFFSYWYKYLSLFVSEFFFVLCRLFLLIQNSFLIRICNWRKMMTILWKRNPTHWQCILSLKVILINRFVNNLHKVHKYVNIVSFFDQKFHSDRQFQNEKSSIISF